MSYFEFNKDAVLLQSYEDGINLQIVNNAFKTLVGFDSQDNKLSAEVYDEKIFQFDDCEELLSLRSIIENPPQTVITYCKLKNIISELFIDVQF